MRLLLFLLLLNFTARAQFAHVGFNLILWGLDEEVSLANPLLTNDSIKSDLYNISSLQKYKYDKTKANVFSIEVYGNYKFTQRFYMGINNRFTGMRVGSKTSENTSIFNLYDNSTKGHLGYEYPFKKSNLFVELDLGVNIIQFQKEELHLLNTDVLETKRLNVFNTFYCSSARIGFRRKSLTVSIRKEIALMERSKSSNVVSVNYPTTLGVGMDFRSKALGIMKRVKLIDKSLESENNIFYTDFKSVHQYNVPHFRIMARAISDFAQVTFDTTNYSHTYENDKTSSDPNLILKSTDFNMPISRKIKRGGLGVELQGSLFKSKNLFINASFNRIFGSTSKKEIGSGNSIYINTQTNTPQNQSCIIKANVKSNLTSFGVGYRYFIDQQNYLELFPSYNITSNTFTTSIENDLNTETFKDVIRGHGMSLSIRYFYRGLGVELSSAAFKQISGVLFNQNINTIRSFKIGFYLAIQRSN